jgi:hypothetical protein
MKMSRTKKNDLQSIDQNLDSAKAFKKKLKPNNDINILELNIMYKIGIDLLTEINSRMPQQLPPDQLQEDEVSFVPYAVDFNFEFLEMLIIESLIKLKSNDTCFYCR